VISITASGVGDRQSDPLPNLPDFENRTYFCAQSTPNSWICSGFKDIRINLAHYSVRSRGNYDRSHVRSWILEGSIDCESWIELDHHGNDSPLNSQGAIATCSILSSADFRYICLRQIGTNSSGAHCLRLNAIEFVGPLKALKPP
jgi:hypothetical protein